MTFAHLVEISWLCAVLPAALFVWNIFLYREPGKPANAHYEPVSVLIPARNEEASIEAAVASILGSRGIDFEVIVLDDSSTDRTSEIVAKIGARDSRVSIKTAPPLPAGWNGKQHACYVLASLATHRTLCFLDADVRLQPEALLRMAAFLDAAHSDLASGFPLEQAETFLERLLLPLIHFVLLAYLPLAGMRLFRAPGFAAGCGQFLMVRRAAYENSGGHANIRSTMHDGLFLPRLFRQYGFRTDIADLTNLATCRMYRSAADVWNGLAKNATEGIAAPARIVPFTVLLVLGQIAPLVLGLMLLFSRVSASVQVQALAITAIAAAFTPRLIAIVRFRQGVASALLHPVGVAVLLALQWYALFRKFTGQNATWRGREYKAG